MAYIDKLESPNAVRMMTRIDAGKLRSNIVG